MSRLQPTLRTPDRSPRSQIPEEEHRSLTRFRNAFWLRSDGERIAINLDIEPVEKPQTALWIEPVHRDPNEEK
jgi:hypothetical protein